jgi:hypothetical protein
MPFQPTQNGGGFEALRVTGFETYEVADLRPHAGWFRRNTDTFRQSSTLHGFDFGKVMPDRSCFQQLACVSDAGVHAANNYDRACAIRQMLQDVQRCDSAGTPRNRSLHQPMPCAS